MTEESDLSNRKIAYYVRCLGCWEWKAVQEGNHHPWCMFCADDLFDWGDERDIDPGDE